MEKGDFNGECNRTVCNDGRANWYNISARKYYCAACANLININNPEFTKEHGFPLCSRVDDIPQIDKAEILEALKGCWPLLPMDTDYQKKVFYKVDVLIKKLIG